MVSLFSQWKSQLFFLPFRFFSRAVLIHKDRCGRWSKRRSGRAPKVCTQPKPCFRFSGTEKPVRSDDFCLYLHIQPRLSAPTPPRRANPAPTKGSVTFLNEEINLSWHPSPAHALALAFMVISFRKGGETICDSIRRGFYALIWFTNLSFSLSAFCFIFLHTAAFGCCAGYCAKNRFFVPNKTKIGFYAKLPSRNIFYLY